MSPAPSAPGGPGPAVPVPTDEKALGRLELRLPLGTRAVVLGDLRLGVRATDASEAVAHDVAALLEGWRGPGALVVAGRLLDPPTRPARVEADPVRAALEAHDRLRRALQAFVAEDDRRVAVVTCGTERAVLEEGGVLGGLGVEVADEVHLVAETGEGERLVVVAGPEEGPAASVDHPIQCDRPWLAGLDRLERPSRAASFVSSRLLYRRLGRFAWWLFVPALLTLALRLPVVASALTHLFASAPGPRHALHRAEEATWATRLWMALAVTVAEVALVTGVLALVSRRIWLALGGDHLPGPFPRRPAPAVVADELAGRLDLARAAVASGAAGLVVGGTLEAELVHLGPGFYASPGGSCEVVREHRGRLGLPPPFLPHLQSAHLELEAGATLHVRLMLARDWLSDSTFLERLASAEHVARRHRASPQLRPALVGSWPRGTAWPPPEGPSGSPRRARRARRLAAVAIFLAGLMDLLVALTPPLRAHLLAVERFVPLSAAQAAGALVALSGLGLMMLARGVLRGQRRAWRVAVMVLGASLALHVVRGEDLDSLALSFAVLGLLIVERPYFRGATDHRATLSAVATVPAGAALAAVAAVGVAEATAPFGRQHLPPLPQLLLAVVERLVGIEDVALPHRLNAFLSPSLLAVGVALVVVTLYLATRPVVDRGLSEGGILGVRRPAELRARDIVRRHGTGTLDYFALRDDKRFFFHRDSLVAYAVYGGIALVSPDPIGPLPDREHVWQAFRHFADRHGWGVAVMAASEEWLATYTDSGMGHVYLGDEAVVDVTGFTLHGGHRKGLRQACTRLARHGYRVEFYDPARLEASLARSLEELMVRQRRGDAERGFSMCLGRTFDHRDSGLLLTVVRGPTGEPAAMCQFVPAPAIGGFSLDLMRRDPGEHPNGLLDFALCSTIEHLREQGHRGLSLNFAFMRSALESQGAGVTQRVERWALRRLSDVFTIESLWRFNAKYDPGWIPRYVVFESAERVAATVAAIVRAESITEMPVVGRFLTPPEARRPGEERRPEPAGRP